MISTSELRLPDLGEGIAEAEIAGWLVDPGMPITEDQPLVEVVTDKASVEIPSPVTGRLLEAVAATGTVVPVGSVIAILERHEPGDELRHEPGDELRQEADGGGPAADRGQEADGGGPAADRGQEADGAGPAVDRGQEATPGGVAGGRPARAVISARLTRAAAVPTVTNVDEADFEGVLASGVSPLSALAAVVARTLPEHPRLNMLAQGTEAVPQTSVHLGIATQTDTGLVVPVVRHAESLALAELDEAIRDVSGRARAGSLRPEELTGSTFTITSAGRLAGLWSTPLLNVPEVAILGLYRIAERPVASQGAVVVRRMGNLSITFDHRHLDGMVAAAFLQAVIDRIEAWPSVPS